MRNYTTMIVALLGAVKVLLSSLFGIEIPNDTVDAIANGVGALLVVIGIIMQHVKKPADPVHLP